MRRKEGEGQMDFFEQQDAARPDFIPSKKDEEWRLRESGEQIKRMIDPNWKNEAVRKNIIAKRNLKKIKEMLEKE